MRCTPCHALQVCHHINATDAQGQVVSWGGCYKYVTNKGLTASLDVRLIGLLLVFASPKIVHVLDEMAEFCAVKRGNQRLSRQGMQYIRGPHKKGPAKREKEERILLCEGT